MNEGELERLKLNKSKSTKQNLPVAQVLKVCLYTYWCQSQLPRDFINKIGLKQQTKMDDFCPLSCLLPEGPKISLIVLNQPFSLSTLSTLWKKSVYKAFADGSTNRFYKLALDGHDEFVPNLISGDFDSAQRNALEYFCAKDGVEVVETPDQDETDFTKCLRLVAGKAQTVEADYIVALGAFGGRFDHCLANVNTLYTARSITDKPLVIVGDGNAGVLLDKGCHTLRMDSGLEGDWCGLIPVGTAVKCVTTTGLKYNLDGDGMQFGGLVSTSNSLVSSRVTVATDAPLLWVQGYKGEEEEVKVTHS